MPYTIGASRRRAAEHPLTPQTPAERLGAAIRTRRLALYLSQSILARRAGIQQNTVSAIERGAYVPRADTLARIAAALDLPPADLLAQLTDEGAGA